MAEEHTHIVQSIKALVKSIPYLSLVDEKAKITSKRCFRCSYNSILKQKINWKTTDVCYHSDICNSTQKNHSIIKKKKEKEEEVLAKILYVQKFQWDFINKDFLIQIDFKASKYVLKKAKNPVSKQILHVSRKPYLALISKFSL